MHRTIIVPVDGSENSQAAFDVAVDMAKAFGGRLLLINIQPSYETLHTKMFFSLEQIEEYRNELGHQVLDKYEVPEGIPCERQIGVGDPKEVICDVAEMKGAKFIVMGSRGLGAIREQLLGSVSYGVLHNAKCPVVVVPLRRE